MSRRHCRRSASADSALAKVEALDENWREPIVARAWLAYRTARLIGASDENFARPSMPGLAHAERALKKAPGDADAIEARGTLHYWQWLNNLTPNPTAANALLASAEQDLRASIAADQRRATRLERVEPPPVQQAAALAGEARCGGGSERRSLPHRRRSHHRTDSLARRPTSAFATRRFVGATRGTVGSRTTSSSQSASCWLYTLPGPKFDMADVWKTYEQIVQMAPPNRQEFYKLKGKLMVALALVRANQLDSAKALAATSQGDSQVDPTGELMNIAATVYAQAGDKESALELDREVPTPPTRTSGHSRRTTNRGGCRTFAQILATRHS